MCVAFECGRPSVLLPLWGGLVPLKEQAHTLPEAVVPDTVDDNITATVSCQDPEGKKREVTPGVSHHVPQHEHSDGGEGRCEGERQYADCLGSFDVWEGGPVRTSSSPCSPASFSHAPLREQFAFSGVPSDAREGHDVNGQRGAKQCEVKGREQQQNIGVWWQLVSKQKWCEVTHTTALVVLQREAAAEDEGRESQQEAGCPGEQDEEQSSPAGHQGVLVERPKDGHAALQSHQEDGADGDEGASGKHRADQHAWLPGAHESSERGA